MRLISWLVLCLLVGLAVAAGASAGESKRKASKATSSRHVAAPRPDGYRELLADKMRVGSSEWWEQMRREGRLGGETP